MAAENERRNDNVGNAQGAGYVNNIQVTEGINASEQRATTFAAAAADANAQNATLQGTNADLQALLHQREAELNALTMQMQQTSMQMQAHHMMNNLQQQAMANQQQQRGGRNRGRRNNNNQANNNANNNTHNNNQQGFGGFQMPPAPTWQPPNTFFGQAPNVPATRWNNANHRNNNNGGNDNNANQFNAQAQRASQQQGQNQQQGNQQAMMWNGMPFQQQQQQQRPRHNGNYCWTHGHRVNNSHTSMTCGGPVQGHQYMATQANTMDGNPRGVEDINM